ncbi:DUF4260 domain-containing protein [Gelatiniphilus marinus]|uniref:DUF4260 domain-containing protein n=1 Tax=Gelatiniphilus marinus TaxID=1759464 RepID=A0ABW5JYI8_9FLAO
MENSLKVEELFMFVLGIYMFNCLDFSWWWFLILILTPDIGMLGYLINSKVGAISYNLFHHKGIAILIFFIGIYFNNQILQLIGAILFSHASLDRIFGYVLKYLDNFKHTHLGNIGK